MDVKWISVVRKIARIWGVVILTLGILMLIAEIVEAQMMELNSYPWFENLIPISFGLGVIGLAVAWKYEGIGGGMAIGFTIIVLLLYLATGRTRVGRVAVILLPVALPGLMFLICWWKSRENLEA
jgi:hypothetical protein